LQIVFAFERISSVATSGRRGCDVNPFGREASAGLVAGVWEFLRSYGRRTRCLWDCCCIPDAPRRRYAGERDTTNLRNRSKGQRDSQSYYYCYHLLLIMPPREPLNLRNERLDSAGSSHWNDGLGSHLLPCPFSRLSAALGFCAPLTTFDSHARYHGRSNHLINSVCVIFMTTHTEPLHMHEFIL